MIDLIKKFFDKKNNEPQEKTTEEKINDMFSQLYEDEITLYIGSDLAEFIDDFAEAISEFRESLFEKTGFIYPIVRTLDKSDFQENQYEILIRGKNYKTGYTHLNKDDAVNEVVRQLENLFDDEVEKIFSNELLEKYIDSVQKKNGWMVWNLTNSIHIWGIKYILISILKRGKSIKDLSRIFEKICVYATRNRDVCHKADPYAIADKVCCEV